MRRVAPLVLACACAAPLQETKKEPAPPARAESPPARVDLPPAVPIEGVAVEYRAQSEGQTLIEVASPAGARVDVREGQALVGRDQAPLTLRAEADHWYLIGARLPSGVAREAKVQARAGQVASIRFADVPPQGPQAM